MGNIFEKGGTLCPICINDHPRTTRCNYDLLIQIVNAMRNERRAFLQRLEGAVNIAKEFQAVIRSMTPELERLVKIELKYNALVEGKDGPKDVQADASQLSFESV